MRAYERLEVRETHEPLRTHGVWSRDTSILIRVCAGTTASFVEADTSVFATLSCLHDNETTRDGEVPFLAVRDVSFLSISLAGSQS